MRAEDRDALGADQSSPAARSSKTRLSPRRSPAIAREPGEDVLRTLIDPIQRRWLWQTRRGVSGPSPECRWRMVCVLFNGLRSEISRIWRRAGSGEARSEEPCGDSPGCSRHARIGGPPRRQGIAASLHLDRSRPDRFCKSGPMGHPPCTNSLKQAYISRDSTLDSEKYEISRIQDQ